MGWLAETPGPHSCAFPSDLELAALLPLPPGWVCPDCGATFRTTFTPATYDHDHRELYRPYVTFEAVHPGNRILGFSSHTVQFRKGLG